MEQVSRRVGVSSSLGQADLRSLARPLSLLLAAACVMLLALTWNTYGLGRDEGARQMYGRLLLDYYRSGLRDLGFLQWSDGQGGLFDLLAAIAEWVWHGTVWDLRHLLSGLCGLAGVLATWKIARLLAGETAALLAAAILMLTGAWSGAMFTHTLEIPLAASMAWALYFQTRLVAESPALAPGTVLGLGVASGLAFALHPIAWLLPASLAVTLVVTSARQGSARLAILGRWLRQLLPGALLALGLALLGRPGMVLGTLPGLDMGPVADGVRSVVPTWVDGNLLMSNEVPRSYLHEYLVVKLPELMLIGLALALGGRPWRNAPDPHGRDRRQRSRHAHPLHLPLALAISLPIVYAWVFRPALADGLRQFLYLLPPMAVAAALGWRMLWQSLRESAIAAWGIAAVTGLLACAHALTLVHLHPYGHAYYNSLVDGLRGASRGWVLDYSASAVREGAEYLNRWLATQEAVLPGSRREAPIPVAVCADPLQARAWLSPRFEVTRDVARAEFLIASSGGDCPQPAGGATVFTVTRQGVPLGQVIDRRPHTQLAMPG